MDVSDFVVKPLKDFAKSSARLVKRCTKPDRKGECLSCGDLAMVCVLNLTETASALLRAEYLKVCGKTAVGFIVMGFIGFFVKLLFIVSPVLHAWPLARCLQRSPVCMRTAVVFIASCLSWTQYSLLLCKADLRAPADTHGHRARSSWSCLAIVDRSLAPLLYLVLCAAHQPDHCGRLNRYGGAWRVFMP